MYKLKQRIGLLVVVAFFGMLGAALAWYVERQGLNPLDVAPYRVYPPPHHVPKYLDGISLRFAMVHDVLHERYPRHGKGYYTERNRLVRRELQAAALKSSGKLTDGEFSLLDDLGAGHDALGQDDEAVRILRDKLKRQQSLGYQGARLYTTYANLGTFLIHGSYVAARKGDAAAKELLREGLGFIHKAIEVNPGAHFGRETWQAVAVEFLLSAIDKPELLLHYDLIGDRLDAEVKPTWRGAHRASLRRRAVVNLLDASEEARAEMYQPRPDPESPGPRMRPLGLEWDITQVGAEDGWKEAVKASNDNPVPFDELTLGIIGMWRLGGGANPYFALTLGEIMLRVGQRYIAWGAYERAAAMQERFWPDPEIRKRFVEHCRNRQEVIERDLPTDERSRLRDSFQKELAYG